MADVLLIGMGPTSLSALESLLARVNMVGLVRDSDANLQFTDPVISRAQEVSLPTYSDISMAAIETLVQRLNPDCVVVSSYNRILQPELIKRCPFINVHYAPLPHYRGRANVNWALINDEPCAGITIHTLVPGLDAGNILFQRLIPIREDLSVADLYEQLNEIQKNHLGDTVINYLNGYQGVPQNHEEATYGCTRIPLDGEINWERSTKAISCLVRALVAPFPGAYTIFKGKSLTIWKAEAVKNPPNFIGRVPGRVVGRSRSDGYVDVLTGDGVLRIFEVQVQGEARAAAADVIKSVRETLGLRVIELLERIQLLEQRIAKLMVTQEGEKKYAL